jgi:undecaprenyl-diphosphatase
MKLEPMVEDTMEINPGLALRIGACQCLAMIPGVSRSGATIVGALMMGVGKRAAAEFSFLLSLPTMGAAVAYDVWKTRDLLDFSAWSEIALGFAVAFVTALAVVRWVLSFVSRHGYAVFGWWRIIVGGVALVALLAGF